MAVYASHHPICDCFSVVLNSTHSDTFNVYSVSAEWMVSLSGHRLKPQKSCTTKWTPWRNISGNSWVKDGVKTTVEVKSRGSGDGHGGQREKAEVVSGLFPLQMSEMSFIWMLWLYFCVCHSVPLFNLYVSCIKVHRRITFSFLCDSQEASWDLTLHRV